MRATDKTYGNLATNLVISAGSIIADTITVSNLAWKVAEIEFVDSAGNVEFTIVVPEWNTVSVRGRFVFNNGLTVSALDEYITVLVLHSAVGI